MSAIWRWENLLSDPAFYGHSGAVEPSHWWIDFLVLVLFGCRQSATPFSLSAYCRGQVPGSEETLIVTR